MARQAATIAALCLTAVLVGCADDDDTPERTGERADEAQPGGGQDGLRRELLDMMEADQAERAGESGANGDESRAARLREIIDEHGWPTFDLVGKEGATAAWLIAQHADFDVEFQAEALDLMRAALEADQADATEVAYLEDRVAVNRAQPQRYGTQVRCRGGRPEPATPIVDAPTVDARRAQVGLEPLADYYEELADACAAEG